MSAPDYGSLYVEAMYGKVCAPDENCLSKGNIMSLAITTTESQIGLFRNNCPSSDCNVVPKENKWKADSECVELTNEFKSDSIKVYDPNNHRKPLKYNNIYGIEA